MISVRKLLPGGAFALTGSTSSQSPKTRMRTMPVTNSGSTERESPPFVITRSVSRSRRSAAIDPAEHGEGHDEHEGEDRRAWPS